MADPWKLSERHCLQELEDMLQRELDDPLNKNSDGSIFLFHKKAQKRIDAIGDAISMHLKQRKIDRGTYESNGYSGRNRNRG